MTKRYQFAEYSHRFAVFPTERGELSDINKTFGSHPDFSMTISPYHSKDRFNSYGSLSLSQDEKNKLDRLKVRQGMSFLDESVSQMEGLFLTLSVAEPEIMRGVSLEKNQHEAKIWNSVSRLAVRKTAEEVTKKIVTFSGGALGGIIAGPPGALIGSVISGPPGKRLYKNIEKTVGLKYGVNTKLKSAYVSTQGIDLALTKAYLLRSDIESKKSYSSVTSNYVESGIKRGVKAITSTGTKSLSMIPFNKSAELVYQGLKAQRGYSQNKLQKISWFLCDLESCLDKENKSIEEAYLRLHPDAKNHDPGLKPGKMKELDAALNWPFPHYKSANERMIKLESIYNKYTQAKSFIEKIRSVIMLLRNGTDCLGQYITDDG